MTITHSYTCDSAKSGKSLVMDNVFTLCYLQLILFCLYQINRIYDIGKAETIFVVYAIVVAELVKYTFFGCERIRPAKNKNSFIFKELIKIFIILSTMVALFYITAVLFGAPFWTEWSETFMFSLILTSVCVLPLCLNLGPDNTVALLLSLNQYKHSNKLVERLWLNFKLTIFGAWLGAVVIPLDWDRPWQVWPVPCCIGAILGCMTANLHSLFTYVKLRNLKPRNGKMI